MRPAIAKAATPFLGLADFAMAATPLLAVLVYLLQPALR